MRDEIKEEIERQLRERDEHRKVRGRSVRAIGIAVVLALFGGRLAWAQQHMNGPGGSHYMADLFKVFFTWTATDLTIAGNRGIISQAASGSNGFALSTNGARVDFGTASDDYLYSDGTYVSSTQPINFPGTSPNTYGMFLCDSKNARVGGQCGGVGTTPINSLDFYAVNGNIQWYIDGTDGDLHSNGTNDIVGATTLLATATPFTMFVTYINNTIAALTYGGGVAPAFNFQVSAVRFYIRTAGSGGSTNATIRITDGTSNCDCTFACNTAAGPVRAACGTDANCDFEASDSMTVSVSGVGDCTTTTDIQGNIEFETLWEQ